jgi:hypothetical protein
MCSFAIPLRFALPSFAAALVASALVLSPTDAHADESSSAPPAAAVTIARSDGESSETRWYGWQTLALDLGTYAVASGTLVATGRFESTDPDATHIAIASTWLGTYLLGAPIIHAAHGHWDRAGMSLGMRAGGWFVGALGGASIGYAIDSKDGVGTGAAIGFLAGFIAPIVIDAAVLSKEKVAPKPRETTVMPTAGLTPNGGGMVGAAGTF